MESNHWTESGEGSNLHLGGARGDLEQFRRRVPDIAWQAAMDSTRAVQRASRAFHVGVDLLFEPGLTKHRIIEDNAFGDLLPNLERDGLDVYGWQIRRLLPRRSQAQGLTVEGATSMNQPAPWHKPV